MPVNAQCIACAANCIDMEAHERLRMARERAGYEDAAAAARRFGWSEPTYRSHENGSRNFTKRGAVTYGRAFRVSPEWLLLGIGEDGRKPVPLVGYVGAGAEVFPIDDGGSLDDVDPPPGCGPDAVAVRVKGDSMYPRYMEGDLLIYDQHTTIEQASGHECVVSLPDGRKYVKIVRKQSNGMVTLESWNAPALLDLSVEWVAIIQWVRRRVGP